MNGFATPSSGTTLRRLYSRDLELRHDSVRGDEREFVHPHLNELIRKAGGPKAVLAAAAAQPVDGSHGSGPALAVTDTHALLFHATKRNEQNVEVKQYPIGAISSVQITQSILICRFEIALPQCTETEKVTLKYNYPDSPSFLKAFTVLRHLLGQPIPSMHGEEIAG
ncbi:MAG: hypothetical protein HY664_05410 [Chloroflexi bacterium]|nr:hypothetical protein [Chloroflexota bacterium]